MIIVAKGLQVNNTVAMSVENWNNLSVRPSVHPSMLSSGKAWMVVTQSTWP